MGIQSPLDAIATAGGISTADPIAEAPMTTERRGLLVRRRSQLVAWPSVTIRPAPAHIQVGVPTHAEDSITHQASARAIARKEKLSSTSLLKSRRLSPLII